MGDMTSHPPIINSNQSTDIIDRQVQTDRNISLGSLESRTEVQRGGIMWSSNYVISMNPPVTTGVIIPHVTRQGSFNLFNPIRGKSDFSDRSVLLYGAAISENPGGDRIFKIAGRKSNFEVEKLGTKMMKFRITSI